jgi:hypothetical protein
MYVKKGRKLTAEEVEDFLRRLIAERHLKVDAYDLQAYARQFAEVNDVLLGDAEGKIYGLVEKYPRALDRGDHYFSIIYVSEGTIRRVWMPEIAELVGAHTKQRDDVPFFHFKSGVIGADRLIESTDRFFELLKRMGGCYAQISWL